MLLYSVLYIAPLNSRGPTEALHTSSIGSGPPAIRACSIQSGTGNTHRDPVMVLSYGISWFCSSVSGIVTLNGRNNSLMLFIVFHFYVILVAAIDSWKFS